jgi:hypothetical protein
MCKKVKGKIPLQGYGARVLWEVKATKFRDIGTVEGGMLSAARTGRFYCQEYPGTYF